MLNLRKIFSERKTLLSSIKQVLILALPFILMDVFIRILASKISYFRPEMILSNLLFTIIWIGLPVGVTLNLKGIASKIFYSVYFGIFFLTFFVHCVYFPYTGFFFNFNLVLLAGEGSAYLLDTVLNTSPLILLCCLAILVLGIFIIAKFIKGQKGSLRNLLIVLIAFFVLHIITPVFMGAPSSALEWDTWRNPRDVYENFNDANKNIKICGLYEYTVRDFCKTFFAPKDAEDPNELAFLEEIYATATPHSPNDYTGIFEGKNLIILQLEGIDSWLFNSEDMPNLYGMLDNSLVFDNHYSFYNGGGSTFNSELAVNTGFITPISYTKNAYTFSTNLYEGSLPKLMKNKGYDVNVFHMNSGEYYSREINYLNWGYDAYYSLMDDGSYKDASNELDRELILNEFFYDKMFKQDKTCVNYIITYTPHTPFSLESDMGQLLAKDVYGDKYPELSEEECARLFAAETDYMVGLLLKALEDNNLIDNTVIVAFADHYLYTLNDKTILDKYKETDNNLINLTPFFIWSNDLSPVTFDKVNSQIDILPTVLNLFGIEYTEEHYIGNDIIDDNYSGYAFFCDYSWYDGNIYSENGIAIKGENVNDAYLNSFNDRINRLIQQNDLTLKYDYFRRMKSSSK